MCGRGLRLSPDKEDCLLLDFGENFKRLGRIDKKRSISLCPSPPRPSIDTKECPECHAQINVFLRICPECGYVFPPGEKEELEDDFLPEFGELLDDETKEKITYIRSQRKMRFTRKLVPDDLWALWSRRYSDTILCNDWLYQAVFRGDTSIAAQQQFLSYLNSFNPQSSKWVSFHMELEFGQPNRVYKSKSKGRYSPPPVNLNQMNWWELLQVSNSATPEEVKSAYSQLAPTADDNEIKLLNWAYEEFENSTKTKSNKEYVLAEVIDWGDVIAEIDLHLARLGWSVDRAKDYLMRTYGVKSRLYLSDRQLLSFLNYLKVQ